MVILFGFEVSRKLIKGCFALLILHMGEALPCTFPSVEGWFSQS